MTDAEAVQLGRRKLHDEVDENPSSLIGSRRPRRPPCWSRTGVAVVLLGVFGCIPPIPVVIPTMGPARVDVPESPAARGLVVAIEAASDGFVIRVNNDGPGPIRFRWDRASFIGTNGVSGLLVPASTSRFDLDETPGPEVIPPGGRFVGSAVTVRQGETVDATHFPGDAPCEDVLGSSVVVVAPIEVDGVVLEYRASMPVDSAMYALLKGGVLEEVGSCGR